MARGYTSLAEAKPELCTPLGEPTADQRCAELRGIADKPPAYKATRFGSEILIALVTGEEFRGTDLAEIVDKLANSKVDSSNWVKFLRADNARLTRQLKDPKRRENILQERIEQLEKELKQAKVENERR